MLCHILLSRMAAKQVRLLVFHFFCQLYFILFYILFYTVQGSDYSISSPATITFSAGSAVNGTTSCANVTIIDDDAVEGNHSFTVHMTGLELNPGGAYSELMTGAPLYATVNIIDNDGKMLLLDIRLDTPLCTLIIDSSIGIIHCHTLRSAEHLTLSV